MASASQAGAQVHIQLFHDQRGGVRILLNEAMDVGQGVEQEVWLDLRLQEREPRGGLGLQCFGDPTALAFQIGFDILRMREVKKECGDDQSNQDVAQDHATHARRVVKDHRDRIGGPDLSGQEGADQVSCGYGHQEPDRGEPAPQRQSHQCGDCPDAQTNRVRGDQTLGQQSG